MKFLSVIAMWVIISPLAMSQTDEKSRYHKFVFAPMYGEEGDVLEDTIDEHIGKYHAVEKIYASTRQGSSVALYRTELKDEFEEEFFEILDHKQYVLKQKKFSYRDWQIWDAVSFIDSAGKIKELSIGGISKSFFSISGLRSYDLYGCLDNKPVYTASLIEGQPDYFFVITATSGNRNAGATREHINVSIISNNGQLEINEKIFWANYVSSTGNEAHFYGEGEVGSKFGEMPIDDGYGRKRYAKMYVSDLDQDNSLDIVFWFKTFKSTSFGEKKGFRYEKESFKWYKENSSSNGFEEYSITNKQALLMLSEKDLTWGDGYPEDNALCVGHQKKYPLMEFIVD
jgi:hypothetical protein